MKTFARTPDSLEHFNANIRQLAAEIAVGQEEGRALADRLDEAARECGKTDFQFRVTRGQDQDPDVVEACRAAHQQALERYQALQEQRSHRESKLADQHDRLNAIHRERRIFVALGGRPLTIAPVADPAQSDPALQDLERQWRDLDATRASRREALEDARTQAAAAEASVRQLRVNVHLGTTTPAELETAATQLTAFRETERALEDECGALGDALQIIGERCTARREALLAATVPTLEVEDRRCAQAFVAALRPAVLAYEHWHVVRERLAPVRPVDGNPWPELRVMVDSKFHRFVAEMVESGIL